MTSAFSMADFTSLNTNDTSINIIYYFNLDLTHPIQQGLS